MIVLAEDRFYGGQTMDEAKDPKVLRNGIQSMSMSISPILDRQSNILDFANHPITSRAHLLDIPAYLAKNDLPLLDPFDTSKIPLDVLKGCSQDAGIKFQEGDILIVHTGFVEAYLQKTRKEQEALVARDVRGWCGVEASEEVMRWHWDHGFAAVATDT
jgi:hypothetical protein